MLMIRMRRVGAKKKPRFRVVVTEGHSAADGAFLEVLGHYNPAADPETIEVDRQRLRYWVDRGAQLTDTVRTVVARHPETAADAAVEPHDTTESAAAAEAPAADEPMASDGAAAEVEAS